MKRKYYTEKVTLVQALSDSWSRDLPYEQVVVEIYSDFGIIVPKNVFYKWYNKCHNAMIKYMDKK